jgi:dephospho-CoA kinase
MNLVNPRSGRMVVLVGRAGVGKDAIGQYLKRQHGFARLAFADPLREVAMSVYGVAPAELLERKEEIIPRLGRSPREILQACGDHARELLGRDIFIRRLVERAVERGVWNGDLVITDARTEAELDFAREQGAAVWWVERPAAAEVRPHPTEAIAKLRIAHQSPRDRHLVNAGTLEELYEQVDAALEADLAGVAA